MSESNSVALCRFGNELVGSVPWGTHLCQFYESKQDLIEILVPYFVEGLRNSEFCMWVTSPPLEVEEATGALQKAVPDLDEYFKKGQIEILSYDDWYLVDGQVDFSRVLSGLKEKEKLALDHGFAGLRLSGNTFWVQRKFWKSFVDYEEAVNSAIGDHRMIAVCTYCLKNCSGTDVLDVVRNHAGTLVKQGSNWCLVEDSARRMAVTGALKLSEKKYSALFENMQDGFAFHKVLFDKKERPVDYIFLEVNDAFERLTGLKRAEIIGERVTRVLPGVEKDPADWIGVYGKVAMTLEPAKFENYSAALGKWYQVSAYCPEKGYFVATFEDITEKKRIERELIETLEAAHRRQAEVSALLESSKAVLLNREFKKASRSIFSACKELLGAGAGYVALLSKDEAENEVLFLDSGGLPCTVDPSLPMPIRGLRAEAYRSGKVVYSNDFSASEWSGFMPKGHMVLKNVLFAPLVDGDKTVGIIGLANKSTGFTERDVQMAKAFGEIASIALMNSQMLEELELKEKLLHAHSESLEKMVREKARLLQDSERLAAIGATAGMVGHDLRNPLQAITGEVFLAKSEVAELPESLHRDSLKESLETIEAQTFYMNKIVSDLQSFVKPVNPEKGPVNLEKLVRATLLQVDVPESIELESKFEAEPVVSADGALLTRVLVNLLTNAVQAMPNGGKLTVQTRVVGESAQIVVRDTGLGIADSVKPKLFIPLFTTKSKGQGFGLAVCKRVIEAHDGTITYSSNEGEGAEFIVGLPLKHQKRVDNAF